MTVKLLFFGATADAVGMRELELDLADGSTVSDVVEKLKQDNLSLAKNKLLTALNEEYAPAETVVRDGDELALFTAVSGG